MLLLYFKTINIVLWEEYCLPWNLKGKRVKFLFGTSGWNCANNMYSCDVSIVTNATKKNSEKCRNWTAPLIKSTTTTTTKATTRKTVGMYVKGVLYNNNYMNV